MVFKTLHWYILRELLRIFVLTASALTTLLAFGGTFKEVTKRGVDVGQLMTIVTNLMPAMLAYTIPIAALFAAVLVYWRLSTDNELTACRASGISFGTIVMPALFLGVAVASTDLLFVNYVVPVFLQRAERAISSDLGSLLVNQIGRQEKFEYDNLVLYADSARLKESPEPNTSVVVLDGAAGSLLKDRKPTQIGIARQAIVTFTMPPNSDEEVQISARLIDGAVFDPKTFQKGSGSVDSQFLGGEKLVFPSIVKSKPKFANLRRLFEFEEDPTTFPPVIKVIERIRFVLHNSQIAQELYRQWEIGRGQQPVIFAVNSYSPASPDELRVYAPSALLSPDQQMIYKELPGSPVRIDQYSKGKLLATFTCGEAQVVLSASDFPGTGATVSLLLRNNVRRRDHIIRSDAIPMGALADLSGVILPPAISASVPLSEVQDRDSRRHLVETALESPSIPLNKLGNDAKNRVQKLLQTITSELHSRGSFAVACLTLVLLGAALGILMRGKNPLAVFVVGFGPAIVMVLLITAGRQVAEGSPRNVPTGIALIWAGNAIILLMVSIAYSKLLRH